MKIYQFKLASDQVEAGSPMAIWSMEWAGNDIGVSAMNWLRYHRHTAPQSFERDNEFHVHVRYPYGNDREVRLVKIATVLKWDLEVIQS